MTKMAWSLAHAQLHTFLRKRILLPHDSRILIAVSGGQDSLCMARLLLDIQHKWRWFLAIAHCDHRWRTDSADNATYVSQLAHQWQTPCWVEVARSPVESEAAARAWRYKIFARLAKEHGYTHVVTGHTASDRAETVLYNLIRGTGLDGLGTLRWERPLSYQSPVSLVRPLLAFSRAETEEFCQQQGITPWQDSSNQTLAFRRNRIRQELLPYLKEHFNPQVERSLAQMAETTAMDIEYIEAQARALYAQVVTERSPRIWQVSRPALQSAPLALQHRVLRQLLQTALGSPANFQHIEKLVALLQAPNGTKTDPFPGGLVAQVRKPVILLSALS